MVTVQPVCSYVSLAHRGAWGEARICRSVIPYTSYLCFHLFQMLYEHFCAKTY